MKGSHAQSQPCYLHRLCVLRSAGGFFSLFADVPRTNHAVAQWQTRALTMRHVSLRAVDHRGVVTTS